MSKFHIKKISEIDQNKLKDFYSNTFKFEKSIQEHYSWRYRLGYNNFEPIVLLVNDEICGHAGLIPANIKIDNKIKQCIWFTDFFVDIKYRSLGFGKLLTEKWMKICPIQITVCNQKSLKVFKKLDWSYNNNFIKKIKVFNYLNTIPIFKNFNISQLSIKNFTKDISIEKIENKIISKLIEKCENKYSNEKTHLIRDESWFKWRIINCPYKKDIFILYFKNEYVVIHIFKKNGIKRLNIVFSLNGINQVLLNAVSNFSKKNNIDFMSYIGKKEFFLDGSIPGQKKLNFAFNSENALEVQEIRENLKDLQFIDSDIDFI